MGGDCWEDWRGRVLERGRGLLEAEAETLVPIGPQEGGYVPALLNVIGFLEGAEPQGAGARLRAEVVG